MAICMCAIKHIHYNQEAMQHFAKSRSQSCSECHKTLLLAQIDVRLLIPVRLAFQTRASTPAHYSIHVAICSSNSLTHAVACSVLDHMQELPVNMAIHMADFAKQLFGHLSGINVAGVQGVRYNARAIADIAQQCKLCMQHSSGLSISGVFVDAHVVSSCAGKNLQVWLCCLSMTAFDIVCRVVNLHRATTQTLSEGHKQIVSKGQKVLCHAG